MQTKDLEEKRIKSMLVMIYFFKNYGSENILNNYEESIRTSSAYKRQLSSYLTHSFPLSVGAW